MGRGIELSDVGFISPSSITARVGIADYHSLVEAQRASGCSVRAFRRGGAPFLLESVSRRKTALVGIMAFFAVVFFLALFVWRIDVTGASEERTLEIMKVLKATGIVPRVARRAVDCDTVRNTLWAEIDGLAFVSVELRGVVLSVNVAEKDIPQLPDGPVDLVAADDAVITDMIVLEGTAHVAVGDSVARGDVLVSAPAAPDPSTSRARAIVRGRVWREFSARTPLLVETRLRTGRRARRLVLMVDGRGTVLPWPAKFEQYDMEEAAVGAGRFQIRWRIMYELVTQLVEMTRDEAAAMAMAQARAEAMRYVEGGVEATSVVERTVDTEDGAIKAVVTVESIEDMSVARSRRTGAE